MRKILLGDGHKNAVLSEKVLEHDETRSRLLRSVNQSNGALLKPLQVATKFKNFQRTASSSQVDFDKNFESSACLLASPSVPELKFTKSEIRPICKFRKERKKFKGVLYKKIEHKYKLNLKSMRELTQTEPYISYQAPRITEAESLML